MRTAPFVFCLAKATVLVCLLVCSNAFVIHKKFTEMCGHNLTLAEPNESLQIDFNVPKGSELTSHLEANCTSFIVWSGPADFKLLPFTARSEHSSATGVDAHPQVVLSITDVQGELIKLDMYGSKPFYLSITPVQKLLSGLPGSRRCAEFLVGCGQQLCIHSQFVCDGVAQCANDELGCFEMPSNYFLVFSFIGVMFSFALVSFLLALYVYFKFYRNTVFLLSADYKPKFYGTVNDSFNSNNSFASLLQGESSPVNQKKALFYDNIQQHYSDNLASTHK